MSIINVNNILYLHLKKNFLLMFKMAFFVSSSSLLFLPEIENQTGDEITLAILNAIALPNPLVAPVMMT